MMPETSLPLIDPAEVSISPDAPIVRAMETIERSEAKIVLVIDAARKLVGSVTDGDIRRGLLNGHTLDSPVSEVMHREPHILPVTTPRHMIIGMMQSMVIRQIPLVHDNGRLAGIVTLSGLLGQPLAPRRNPVVIMAGGKGQRLQPLTASVPKPMVEISGRPILDWILQRFVAQGFREFYFTVHHLGHVIEDYFGDGSRFNCAIHYVRERRSLGTAGGLSLLPDGFDAPLVVINGDILASIDFGGVVDYHVSSGADATVCARPHHMEVPFGVIQIKNGVLKTIVEKPVYEDLVSAGIYVLNPEVLRLVPPDAALDMPQFLVSLVERRRTVGVFPLREEWMDVGRHDDLERARLMLVANKSG